MYFFQAICNVRTESNRRQEKKRAKKNEKFGKRKPIRW